MKPISVIPDLVIATELHDSQFDSLVLVSPFPDKLPTNLAHLTNSIQAYIQADASKGTAVILSAHAPGGRIIYSPTGLITRDYDDVRRYAEAAEKGINRALAAGSKSPLVCVQSYEKFSFSIRVAYLGVLQALYVPIEIREAYPDKIKKVVKCGFLVQSSELTLLKSLEAGRIVCRDIGGSDPERMAAPRVAEYIQQIFDKTDIKVKLISDPDVFSREYPLLAAVNRATKNVPRHHGRLIFLEYVGEGIIDTTLILVGKGITYDTGGADVKAGGHMAGMHRDKCGAAFVAGFFQFLTLYKPKGLKVIGSMSMVRNSIGSECYVADEIITSRAGVRVRIGNTDAEGRMVMGDVLCHMKERAINEVNPILFTIATLTGHVIRAFGPNYTAIVENGPANKSGVAKLLQEAGDKIGDPFEISTLRREDYEFHQGKSEYEDVLQSNNFPSTMTDRGHQTPAAFLNIVSGLDKHGCDSIKPLPYSHVDIAGSSGPFPGVPTAAPLLAMAEAYVLSRERSHL